MIDQEKEPAMKLETAVANLSVHRDEWLCLLKFLGDEKDSFQADLRQAETPNDVMKIAGSVATIAELKSTLTPQGWD